jgi:hypothetical protein
MLLTDALVSGKDGLFICQSVNTETVSSESQRILDRLQKPTLCVNQYHGVAALLYPLSSI